MKTEKELFYEVAEMIMDHPDSDLTWDDEFLEKRYQLKLDGYSRLAYFYEGNPKTGVIPLIHGQVLGEDFQLINWYLDGTCIVWKDDKPTVKTVYEKMLKILGKTNEKREIPDKANE